VNQLLKEQGVVYALGEIDEPIQNEEMFSTSLVVKVLVKSFPFLTNICATHSPFSIEILKPDEIRMPLNQAHELLSTVATTTSDYKKYIIEKVTTKEELENYHRILEQKAKLGRMVLGRKEGAQEAEKGSIAKTEEDKKE
jgi:predicted ATP-binding protein involved in virulence